MKLSRTLPLLIISIIINSSTIAQTSNNKNHIRYTKTSDGYTMVLRQGDSLFTELKKFANAENIPFAHFTGLGFAHVTFSFFDAGTKKYNSKYFENLEMGSLTGSIAWQKDTVSIHAHGIGADKHFAAFGGHILSAVVSTGSLEIFITVSDKKFERKKDEELGANVLEIR